MKRIVSMLAAVLLCVFPLMTYAENQSMSYDGFEKIPFSFDMEGNTVTLTSAKAYTANHFSISAYGSRNNENVILAVFSFDVSALPDNLLSTFFENVDLMSYNLLGPYDSMYRVFSVVWADSHLAQCVMTYDGEKLQSNDWVFQMTCKGDKPFVYITDSDGTRIQRQENIYLLSITFDDAEDFVSMGSDLCQLLMSDYHYDRR